MYRLRRIAETALVLLIVESSVVRRSELTESGRIRQHPHYVYVRYAFDVVRLGVSVRDSLPVYVLYFGKKVVVNK